MVKVGSSCCSSNAWSRVASPSSPDSAPDAVHYTGADRGQEITPYLAAARAVAGELEQQ